jgi:hypothetical protein
LLLLLGVINHCWWVLKPTHQQPSIVPKTHSAFSSLFWLCSLDWLLIKSTVQLIHWLLDLVRLLCTAESLACYCWEGRKVLAQLFSLCVTQRPLGGGPIPVPPIVCSKLYVPNFFWLLLCVH